MNEITSFSETITRTDIIPCKQCGSYQIFMDNILSKNKFTSKIYCIDCGNSQYYENSFFHSSLYSQEDIANLKQKYINMWNVSNT